jgi:hypothetical protein
LFRISIFGFDPAHRLAFDLFGESIAVDVPGWDPGAIRFMFERFVWVSVFPF